MRFIRLLRRVVGIGACLIVGIGAPADAARRSAPAPDGSPLLYVGAHKVRVSAIVHRGNTLVPVRGVFEAIGADVAFAWPQFIVVRKDGAVIAAFTLGRTRAIAGHRAVDLVAPPMRRNGRVYVPLRIVAEAAGATVAYTSRPAIVHIWPHAAIIAASATPINTRSAAGTSPSDIGTSSSTATWLIGVAVFTGLCGLACLVLLARRFASTLFSPLQATAKRLARQAVAPFDTVRVDDVALTSVESSGEARFRKRLVTETRTIEVPVTREELVIEYAGEGGTVIIQGRPLAAGETVRIPLWEERVHVDVTKHVMLKEDIVVDKRRITAGAPVFERGQDFDLAEGSPS